LDISINIKGVNMHCYSIIPGVRFS